MRASVIAPALTVWLLVGAMLSVALATPWYIGGVVGFVAAAITYWLWPKLAWIPVWVLHILTAAVFGIGAMTAGPEPAAWLAGIVAILQLALAVRAYLRRREPTQEPFS